MNNEELKKKIMETIDNSVDDWAIRDKRGRIHVYIEKIADALIAARIGDVSKWKAYAKIHRIVITKEDRIKQLYSDEEVDEIVKELKRLENENAELKDQWDNLRCVYSFDGDVMEYCVNGPCPHDKFVAKVREENDELKERLSQANEECLKWHERAQNLIKENGGSIFGYEKTIKELQSENAALRERLKNAVELPCKVGDKVYAIFPIEDELKILDGTFIGIEEVVSDFKGCMCAIIVRQAKDGHYFNTYWDLGQFNKTWWADKKIAESKLAEVMKNHGM